MADIFLSYSQHEKIFSKRMNDIYELLRKEFSVFKDVERLEPGQVWREVIEAELEACRVGLVVWTSASAQSKEVLAEAEELLKRGKLTHVALEPVKINYLLKTIQYERLDHWTGHPGDKTWKKVVAALRQRVQAPEPSRLRGRVLAPEDIGTDADIADIAGSLLQDWPGLPPLVPMPGVEGSGASMLAFGAYLVTRGEWNEAVLQQAYGLVLAPIEHPDDAARPVTNITWDEAKGFIAWLNARIGDQERYRLPTEAEWRRAAADLRLRDGKRPSADPPPRRVGSGLVDPFGAEFDFGNVWEWVDDTYRDAKENADAEPANPDWRVACGGSWRSGLSHADIRTGFSRRYRSRDVGFRIVRDLQSPSVEPSDDVFIP